MILHLGNVSFSALEASGPGEVKCVPDEASLSRLSASVGIDSSEVLVALVNALVEVRGVRARSAV